MYDYLAEFAVLVQEGTFTKAAARLNFSQSVLSRHISALEAELGCTLINRTTHGFALTEAGTLVVRRARDLLEIGADIRFAVGQLKQQPATLSVCGVLANTRLLAQIRRAACTLGFEVSVLDVAHDLDLATTLDTADVLFTFLADARLSQEGDTCTHQVVHEGQLLIAMGPGNPLATRASLTSRELEDLEIWRPEGEYLSGYIAWEEFRRTCRDAGFYPKSRTAVWEGPNSMYALDLHNLASPVVPGTPLETYARECGCALVPVEGMKFPVVVGAYRADNPRAARLVERMAQVGGTE